LESWARRHPVVLTLEDNVATGGFGSAVSEALAPLGIPVTVMAVPDSFIEQGGQSELLQKLGLDAQGVAARVRRTLGELDATPKQATQPGS
jgi:1-deoxy-D-xylulose-5-phosphate synthase